MKKRSLVVLLSAVCLLLIQACESAKNDSSAAVIVEGNGIVVYADELDENEITLEVMGIERKFPLHKVKEGVYRTDGIFHEVLKPVEVVWKLEIQDRIVTGSVIFESSPLVFTAEKAFFDHLGNLVLLSSSTVAIYSQQWLFNPISYDFSVINLEFIPNEMDFYKISEEKSAIILRNEERFQTLVVDSNGKVLEEVLSSFNEDISESKPVFDVWNKRMIYYLEGKGTIDFKGMDLSYDPEEGIEKFSIYRNVFPRASIIVNENVVYRAVVYPGPYISLKRYCFEPEIYEECSEEVRVHGELISEIAMFRNYILIPYVNDRNLGIFAAEKESFESGDLNSDIEGEKFEITFSKDNHLAFFMGNTERMYLMVYDSILRKVTSYEIYEDSGSLKVNLSQRKEENVGSLRDIFLISDESGGVYLTVTGDEDTRIYNFDLVLIKKYDFPIHGFFKSERLVTGDSGEWEIIYEEGESEYYSLKFSETQYIYEFYPKILSVDLEPIDEKELYISIECTDQNFEEVSLDITIDYIPLETNPGHVESTTTQWRAICIGTLETILDLKERYYLQSVIVTITDTLGQEYRFCYE